MNSRTPINIIERNPHTPQPFVLSEVATCLRDAIRAAGYPSEHLVNRIDPQAYSIVLGGSTTLANEIEHLDPARCAIFNLEQLGNASSIANVEYRRWLADWLVLDYRSSNIAFLKAENGPRQLAFELPIVPSASLVTHGDMTRTVDVLFYGTMSDRRAQVLRELEAMGLTVEIVAGAYGAELAPAIRRARLVLHIHHDESSLFPVARVLQPMMMGVPIVCESSVFSELNDWSHSGIVFADYAHLAETCRDMLDAADRLQRRAEITREYVEHLDFRTPFADVARAFETLAIHVAENRGEAPPHGSAPLTTRHIETILEVEGVTPPEAGQPAPPIAMVEKDPVDNRIGKWVAWVLVAVMIGGAIKAYL